MLNLCDYLPLEEPAQSTVLRQSDKMIMKGHKDTGPSKTSVDSTTSDDNEYH